MKLSIPSGLIDASTFLTCHETYHQIFALLRAGFEDLQRSSSSDLAQNSNEQGHGYLHCHFSVFED